MRKVGFGAALVALLIVAWPGGATPSSGLSATRGAFIPPYVSAAPADTVTFSSLDTVNHSFATGTAALCGFGREPLPCYVEVTPGQTAYIFIHRDAPVGRYQFYCGIHPWMLGFLEIHR